MALKWCGYHTLRATRLWNNVVSTLWEQRGFETMWLPRSESNEVLKQCGYHALTATRLWNNVVTTLWEQPGFETMWLLHSESSQVLKQCGYHALRTARFWNNVVTMLWEQPEGRKKGKPFQSWPVIPQVVGEHGSDCLMSNAADRSSSLYSTETFILSAKVSNLLVTRTKSVSVEWFYFVCPLVHV